MKTNVRRWDHLTSVEARDAAAADPVLILPLAAVEQHGPHLPVSTDVDIGAGLLAEALGRLGEMASRRVYTLPGLALGASPEHAGFAGTLSLEPDTMERTLADVGASLAASGIRRLVVVNSHGGNKAVLDTAALGLRRDHGMLVVKASWFRFPRPGDDAGLPETEWEHGLHGGAVETAMMLHLHPDRVRRDAIRDFPSLGEELAGELLRVRPEGAGSFAWLAADLNPHGVTGNAGLATAELGEALVTHYGTVLAEILADTLRFPLDRLKPVEGGDREAGPGGTHG